MKPIKNMLETTQHVTNCSLTELTNYKQDPSFAKLTKLQQKYYQEMCSNLSSTLTSLKNLIKDMSKPTDQTVYHIEVQKTGWNSRLNCWDSFNREHIQGTIDELQEKLIKGDYWHVLTEEEVYKAKKINQILALFRKQDKLDHIKSHDFSVKYKFILVQ